MSAMKHEVMYVTPDLAAVWLKANRRADQRKLSASRVAQWADAMRRGDWRLTPQAVVFDADGLLMDGQHRLAAVVESGCTVQMVVCWWPTADIMPVLDTGFRRTAAQSLNRSADDIAIARAMRADVPPDRRQNIMLSNTAYVARLLDHYADWLDTLRGWGLMSTSGGHSRAYVVAQFGKALAAGVDAASLAPVAHALRTPSDGRYAAINILRLALAERRGAGGGPMVVEMALKTQRAIAAALAGEHLSKLYAPARAIYPPVLLPQESTNKGGAA